MVLLHHVGMETKKPLRRPTAHLAPFGLRLQPELKAQLEDAAARAGRSLNAEITARLEQSFGASIAPDAAADIHVVIDSSGYPISWREIGEQVSAIIATSALPVVSMTTTVLTPEVAPNRATSSHLSKIRAAYKKVPRKR